MKAEAYLLAALLSLSHTGRSTRATYNAVALPPAATQEVDFARDIRPILKRACYGCHGPTKQESGLRLDNRQSANEGGDNGPVFEAGKSAESELVIRISGVEPERVMPPKGQRLSDREVGLIRAWIDQGARWPDAADAHEAGQRHWSFVPVRRPKAPTVRQTTWPLSPIDIFVLSKLEGRRMHPSPMADRYTLARRLSLDLLGLPPAPADVDAFVNDQSPDAYERHVERLLASPYFGERWGRHWLDLARYADSDGYEKDLPRPFAWRWRNWVIDAFNRDMPYDRFSVEQIAGDLLANANTDQRVATGFHRNTLTNREGGVDPEEYRVKAIVDRVNTTGTVWLGLTVGCCECHSHKFDPLTQREYYGLFAFFNDADEIDIPAPLPQEWTAYELLKAQYDRELARLRKAMEAAESKLADRQADWERRLQTAGAIRSWQIVRPASMMSAGGAELRVQQDGTILVSGNSAVKDTYTLVFRCSQPQLTAIRIEAIPDPTLPQNGPGRAANGNFVISEIQLAIAPPDGAAPSVPVALANAYSSVSQPGFSAASSIDGDPNTGWAIGASKRNASQPIFIGAVAKTPVQLRNDSILTVSLKQLHGRQHVLGRFQISVTDASADEVATLVTESVRAILTTESGNRSADQRSELAIYYRSIDPNWVQASAALEAHLRGVPIAPNTQAPALAQRAERRATRVHLRGDFLRQGPVVQPHTPDVLPPIRPREKTPNGQDQVLDRLDLADWIVQPAHPLTARVAVNRVWNHLFGRGLVATLDDFGTRGDPPSHPELLDWLADAFVTNGWSHKDLIRRIVCSATYRQSSHFRPELLEADPDNVLLARQNRLRVEGETVRDVALAASGLWCDRIGGPSVRPPIPTGVADLGYAGSVKWPESTGADRYRRGLYVFFQRTVPYPMLRTFDAPDAGAACTRRERSNTPLQALTLLNDPVFVECADALARRLNRDRPNAALRERLQYAFRVVLSRPGTAAEIEAMLSMHRDFEAIEPSNSPGSDGPKTPRVNADSQATTGAMVGICRTLLNLDEFVTRE